jgi:hypothetical protein
MLDRDAIDRAEILYDIATGTMSVYGSVAAIQEARDELLSMVPGLLVMAGALLDAPAVAITECNQIAGASDFDFGDMSAACQQFSPGQTVRLVAENGS